MVQNEQLHVFSIFNSLEEKETFVKCIIWKQLDLSYISVAASPTNQILRQYLHLMQHIYDSNFYKILAGRLNTAVTVRQFAKIFAQVLDEQLDNILIN